MASRSNHVVVCELGTCVALIVHMSAYSCAGCHVSRECWCCVCIGALTCMLWFVSDRVCLQMSQNMIPEPCLSALLAAADAGHCQPGTKDWSYTHRTAYKRSWKHDHVLVFVASTSYVQYRSACSASCWAAATAADACSCWVALIWMVWQHANENSRFDAGFRGVRAGSRALMCKVSACNRLPGFMFMPRACSLGISRPATKMHYSIYCHTCMYA